MYKKLTAFTIMCLLLGTGTALAQETTAKTQVDKSALVKLYDQYLEKNLQDDALEEKIAAERQHIRELITMEIWESISLPTESENLENLPEAVDRQRKILFAMEQRLKERQVDLDLLNDEEKRFILNGVVLTRVLEDTELRLNYADLLAKKVILEERISVLEGIVPVQQDRLEKLQSEQFREQLKILVVFGKYLAILFLIILLQKLIRKFFISRIPQLSQRYAISKLLTTGTYTVFIVWILANIFAANPGFITSLALVGAGLAVALQDVVKDIVGWLVIHQGRFSVGDRITINDITGEVVDIGVLRTTLLEVGTDKQHDSVQQHTGRTLFIPNSLILTNPVTNYHKTSDFLKTELHFEITFESDWRKAQKILQEILEEETTEFSEKAHQQYMRRTAQLYIASALRGPKVYFQIASSGIEFTLRFDTPIGGRRPIITKICDRILESFNQEQDINLAYSTIRVVPTPSEEK